jgi:hypothetical protein
MADPEDLLDDRPLPTREPTDDSQHHDGVSLEAEYARRDQESGSREERCPALRTDCIESDAAASGLGHHSRHGALSLAQE